MYKLITAASAAEAANEAFNRSMERIGQTIDDQKNKINELLNVIRSADSSSLQKQMAFDELSVLSPALAQAYDSLKKLEEADLTNVNRQVSELADESRLSMLKSQADALEGLVKELSKMNRLASIGAGSGAGDYAKLRSALKSEYGIQGSVAWDVGDWSEAAQEVLNNIRREIEKIEDAKRRISCLLYTSPSPRDTR